MRVSEAIERFAPETVKKIIPIKATSLDNFAALVTREGGTAIHAQPIITVKDGRNSWTVGHIGNYEYSTRYTSQTSKGRKIIYNEIHRQRFGSEYGFADAQDRSLTALRGLITAESRLDELKERLPQVQTHGPTTKMNEAIRQRMWSEARKHNITPFPKTKVADKPTS